MNIREEYFECEWEILKIDLRFVGACVDFVFCQLRGIHMTARGFFDLIILNTSEMP